MYFNVLFVDNIRGSPSVIIGKYDVIHY